MIPKVFVSSTVQDLHYLRDIMRDTLAGLAYVPVMSEYGDIGYLPKQSVVESCYTTMKECQLAILIIGLRYGSLDNNGFSVTHNEFRQALKYRVPVLTLVDQEVLVFKKVFDAQDDNHRPSILPGMDDATKTFAFLEEIRTAEINNAFLPFSNGADAVTYLKKQLAHMFGDYLRKDYEPAGYEIKEVLAEVKSLRHALLKSAENKKNEPYLRCMRLLLTDKEGSYREIAEALLGNLDIAVPQILESPNFEDFVQKAGGDLIILNDKSHFGPFGIPDSYDADDKPERFTSRMMPEAFNSTQTFFWVVTHKKKVMIDANALTLLNKQHKNYRTG